MKLVRDKVFGVRWALLTISYACATFGWWAWTRPADCSNVLMDPRRGAPMHDRVTIGQMALRAAGWPNVGSTTGGGFDRDYCWPWVAGRFWVPGVIWFGTVRPAFGGVEGLR